MVLQSEEKITSIKRKSSEYVLIPCVLFRGHQEENDFLAWQFITYDTLCHRREMERIYRMIRSLVDYAYFYKYERDEGRTFFAIELHCLLGLLRLSQCCQIWHIMLDALRAFSIIFSTTGLKKVFTHGSSTPMEFSAMTPEMFTSITNMAVEGGVINLLLDSLKCPLADTREVLSLVVLSLGNISAENSYCRDSVLQKGGMSALLALLSDNIEMNRIITWAISNLCHGKPEPSFEKVKDCLLPVLNILEKSSDFEVRLNVLRTLSFISNTSNDNIKIIVDSGIFGRLVEINEPSLIFPAVLAVGNILLTGNESECDSLLQLGVLPWLKKAVSIGLNNTKSSACWAISNIASRGEKYVEEVIKEKGLVETLNKLLTSELPRKVKRYAATALSYVTDIIMIRLLVVYLKCLRNFVGENHLTNNIIKLLSHDHPEVKAEAKEFATLVGIARWTHGKGSSWVEFTYNNEMHFIKWDNPTNQHLLQLEDKSSNQI